MLAPPSRSVLRVLIHSTAERARRISTSTWSDVLDELGTDGVIDGVVYRSGTTPVAGPALTVREMASARPTEHVQLDMASIIDAAMRGCVLVIATASPRAVSTFGGLAARALVAKGAAGVVIEGACRDLEDLHSSGLFVASREVTPRSGRNRARVVAIGEAVTCGGVTVRPGDWVVADKTGVVVVPIEQLEAAVALAEKAATRDAEVASRLEAGLNFRAATE